MRLKMPVWFAFALLAVGTAGCGGFMARRMAQAPNTYPSWLAPAAPVELALGPQLFTNFPARYVEVGPPPARLRYRVIEPADYQFKVASTNRLEHGRRRYVFTFDAVIPARTNAAPAAPRGTVLLLHGYGLGQFAMMPWALRLAGDGWRCVLVDLRGHGKSTGRRIFFGVKETRDLSQLADELARSGQLAPPLAVMGESYGAALALRWKAADPRVGRVVAIAPYAVLSNAVLNVCHEYAGWFPRPLLRSGLNHLSAVLEVRPGELDTTTVLARSPVVALFVAGAEDRVVPVEDVRRLSEQAGPGSEWIVVPQATHEAVTYFFDDLAPPVVDWLAGKDRVAGSRRAASP